MISPIQGQGLHWPIRQLGYNGFQTNTVNMVEEDIKGKKLLLIEDQVCFRARRSIVATIVGPKNAVVG
jgi:hypothetical protein